MDAVISNDFDFMGNFTTAHNDDKSWMLYDGWVVI